MKNFLVTVSSSICRDSQVLRISGEHEKYIKEDDVGILEDAADMKNGDGNVYWCDISNDIVLDEYTNYQGTSEDIKKEISENYGINPYFINVYEISNN